MFYRIKEASTWAGVGLVATSLSALIASNGTDVHAWAGIAGGLAAIVLREGPR